MFNPLSKPKVKNASLSGAPEYQKWPVDEAVKDESEMLKLLEASNSIKAVKAEKKEDTDSFLVKMRKKVISLDTLLKYGTFRFKFQMGKSTEHIRYLKMFFAEHGIEGFDFECQVKTIYNFNRLQGQRIAIVDGVVFFMIQEEGDNIRTESLTLYTPIWQREEAGKILRRELLKYRPLRQLIYNGGYGRKTQPYEEYIGKQQQYVRPDVYEYVDRIFKRMVNEKEWYLESGKEYKETFLLHGAPGTGKTSLYMHFAGLHDLNVLITDPADFSIKIESIIERAKQDTRKPLMVLIEDIDSCNELLLQEFKTPNHHGLVSEGGEFTYSTFINALCGAHKLYNMIVCLSSNYKEKLIPSIYRAGRVDHQLDIIPLSSAEIAEHVNTELSEYINSFPDETFAIANIIDLKHCKTKEEIDNLVKWLKA